MFCLLKNRMSPWHPEPSLIAKIGANQYFFLTDNISRTLTQHLAKDGHSRNYSHRRRHLYTCLTKVFTISLWAKNFACLFSKQRTLPAILVSNEFCPPSSHQPLQPPMTVYPEGIQDGDKLGTGPR